MQGPQAPNPIDTANAQSGFNKETAQTQQQMGMVNQKGPLSSTTYGQIGNWADGDPRYEQTSAFAPNVQNLVDQNINRAGTPFSLSNEATESRLMDLGRKRLDPALDRRRASTEQSLFNRGVRPGSEAYKRGMEAVSQGENDAYNELMLSGRAQAGNELLTERNQPFNEFASLVSGAQVQTPQLQGPGVAPVDYTGLAQNDYNAKYRDYSNTWNAVGNIGSTLGGWFLSSRDKKTDIKKVAETGDDQNVYRFRYKGSPMMHVGLMADEVKQRDPGAVKKIAGADHVNYPRALRKAGGLMAIGGR